MSYLKLDKEQLINLEYALNREILLVNQTGSYINSTLNGCNTRKYHGLLVCPIDNFGGEKHVLLSSLHETVIQNKAEFNLGINRYRGGIYEPNGHKYIHDVKIDNIPVVTYHIGGIILTKERILVENEKQVLTRYTLEEANCPTVLRFKPFLAFRNIHHLSKANLFANTKYKNANNGISLKLYDGYPDVFMQFSKNPDFVPAPDWYYDIEYTKELNRGYEYLEDLFVPGYFELTINKGESIVFSTSTFEPKTVSLKQRFTRETKKRQSCQSFLSSLYNAASQFIICKNNETDIMAGFPWYNSITRQTFISLPGICLALNDLNTCQNVLKNYLKYLNNGFFPDYINDKNPQYNSADAPLWFIWTLQQYLKKKPDPEELWTSYGIAITEILYAYKNSTLKYVGMNNDGLIYAEKSNTALTWMNSYIDSVPVVQRGGLSVEINALWFNAVCFALNLAKMNGDDKFVGQWGNMVEKIEKSFLKTFCHPWHEHLADVVRNGVADWSVRPNMVIAVALDYSPLSIEQKISILGVAKNKLLTSRGMRTLSPDHLKYAGTVEGSLWEREMAMHQGAVWPWLIQFFVEGYIKIHNKGGLPFVEQIIEGFEKDITENCIGTISEMYSGNPPHHAEGAISQAWNIAGIIYATHFIQNFKN
ncbi:MAG: amylo-alpha-1,6-glucosidase [Bacteroidales bacterium]|jgi:predicted glycogen debranching enzyme|nr:amylo-alpha-1,6-glucosidase [Bacteroidales bacterium]